MSKIRKALSWAIIRVAAIQYDHFTKEGRDARTGRQDAS